VTGRLGLAPVVAAVLVVTFATLARAAPPEERRALAADAALGGLGAARPGAGKRPNALIQEKSPYLREHAFDPVNWHPWGAAALDEAKRRNLPLFVSSGYSTCHWCHVMHRESFEDAGVAAILNAGYVCVKIDREELPDVDEGLIRAITALAGSAGWPVTVFMGNDGRPFYGGTYFPRPALVGVLNQISALWKDEKSRAGIGDDAQKLADFLATTGAARGKGKLDRSIVAGAVAGFAQVFDKANKGFGDGAKFPEAPNLTFLLRLESEAARKMALETLDRILEGGIRDHVGGGFHRYATDAKWRVPHFEKTLYDQALLAGALTDAYRLTGEPRYANGVRTTLDYVLRDLALPSGGFASAEDADSSGEEGLFYTWTQGELETALPERLARYAHRRFGIEPMGQGAVGGRSVAYLARSSAEAAAGLEGDAAAIESETVAALLLERSKRVRPARDEKVLTGWNGLAIAALARASWVLGEPRYLEAARRAATLVEAKLRRKDGRVLRRLVGDEARFQGALEDHAYLAHGYVELYEATLEPAWLARACDLLTRAHALFWDADRGAFGSRARDAESLLATPGRDEGEGALPGPAAVLALELVRTGTLTGRDEPLALARSQLETTADLMRSQPYAVPTSLAALDALLRDPVAIVLAGPRGPALDALLEAARRRPLPGAVLALVDPAEPACEAVLGDLARGRMAKDGRPQAFVCVGKTCLLPVDGAEALAKVLAGIAR
jgi:uncharacterized protein YyaL (SSP411 family)